VLKYSKSYDFASFLSKIRGGGDIQPREEGGREKGGGRKEKGEGKREEVEDPDRSFRRGGRRKKGEG